MSKTGADQGTKQALLYSIFRSIRQIFPVMISIFFCMGVFVFSNVSVFAKEQETVKVGYYFSHNFQEGTDDTSPKSGYGYEYLPKLASYTGWKYEYIYGEFFLLMSGSYQEEIEWNMSSGFNASTAA